MLDMFLVITVVLLLLNNNLGLEDQDDEGAPSSPRTQWAREGRQGLETRHVLSSSVYFFSIFSFFYY
jgi:hypothetical protein